MDLAIRHVYTVHIICMSCVYTCVLYRWARPCEAHPLQLRVWDHSITHFLSLSLSLSGLVGTCFTSSFNLDRRNWLQPTRYTGSTEMPERSWEDSRYGHPLIIHLVVRSDSNSYAYSFADSLYPTVYESKKIIQWLYFVLGRFLLTWLHTIPYTELSVLKQCYVHIHVCCAWVN